MLDVRKIIAAELKKQKKSRYWLAKQIGGTVPHTYQFLSGRNDVSIDKLQRALDALGLVIVPGRTPKRTPKQPKLG